MITVWLDKHSPPPHRRRPTSTAAAEARWLRRRTPIRMALAAENRLFSVHCRRALCQAFPVRGRTHDRSAVSTAPPSPTQQPFLPTHLWHCFALPLHRLPADAVAAQAENSRQIEDFGKFRGTGRERQVRGGEARIIAGGRGSQR